MGDRLARGAGDRFALAVVGRFPVAVLDRLDVVDFAVDLRGGDFFAVL